MIEQRRRFRQTVSTRSRAQLAAFLAGVTAAAESGFLSAPRSCGNVDGEGWGAAEVGVSGVCIFSADPVAYKRLSVDRSGWTEGPLHAKHKAVDLLSNSLRNEKEVLRTRDIREHHAELLLSRSMHTNPSHRALTLQHGFPGS